MRAPIPEGWQNSDTYHIPIWKLLSVMPVKGGAPYTDTQNFRNVGKYHSPRTEHPSVNYIRHGGMHSVYWIIRPMVRHNTRLSDTNFPTFLMQ